MPDTADHTRRLEYLPLTQVLRAPRNPNGHQLPAIASSIRRHGFVEPVIVDERTGCLLGGHGRLDVLTEMADRGEAAPPGITATPDGWQLPVILGWASRDDAEAEALLLAMMRLPKEPVSDGQLLYSMLDDLLASSVGLDGTGYDADTLDDLLNSLGHGELPDAGTDAAHAPLLPRGDPQAPRNVQGLHEIGLMFQADQHREYLEHLAKLRRAWATDAAPLVVLRALRDAAAAT